MRTIEVYSFPYYKGNEVYTRLFIDKQEINNPDNRLTQFVVKKPMNKWLRSHKRKLFVWKGFLYELAVELNASDYTIIFNGPECDFQVFAQEMMLQKAYLEHDGRKINMEIIFRERFDCKKAVRVMVDAYDSLIHKELTDGNFAAQDKIKYAKESLTAVSSLIKTFGTMDEDFETRLKKKEIIKINHNCARVIAAVFGADCTEDICSRVSELLKGKKFEKALVIIPKSADTDHTNQVAELIARECDIQENTLYFNYYTDDPLDALEDGIYARYMPDVITEAIEKFYEIAEVFDGYETDSYILDACRQIDELFD